MLLNSIALIFTSLSFAVAANASGNEFEATFNKFMANFTAEITRKSANISYQHLEQLKAENNGQLPMSDSEFIQESDFFLQEKIDLFKVKAHKTFLDAISNTNKNYYIFDTDRSLWHKPDQGFEKVLFDGANRNAKILRDQLTEDLEATLTSSQSDLEKRKFAIGRLFPGITRSFTRGSRVLISRFKSPTVVRTLKGMLLFSTTLLLVFLVNRYWKFTALNDKYSPAPRYRIGNKVLTEDVNIYLIWYGDWAGKDSGIETMEYLADHISDSNWYTTLRDYYYQANLMSKKTFINGTAHFKKSYFDIYSAGRELNDPLKVEEILKNQLAGNLPDPNGLYFVFGSPDIAEHYTSNENACGWHSYTHDLADYPTYYAYVQNVEGHHNCHAPILSPDSSPNSDLAVDAMASIFAHELVEIISDPIPDNPSWINSKGLENADICAWKFGNVTRTPDGKVFNSKVGDRNFLIQGNWDLHSNNCSIGKK